MCSRGEGCVVHYSYELCYVVNKTKCFLKMQVQNPDSIKYKGTIQGLKYIWKTEGFRGMFKGNGTNCARIIPNSAVKFFSYEQASEYAYPHLLSDIYFIAVM